MATKSFTIKGTSPLIMNSSRGVDSTDELVRQKKKIVAKRSKDMTEADQAAVEKVEYAIALYTNADGVPVIPSTNLEAVIKEGAKKSKSGKLASAGVFVHEDAVLQYEGPKDLDGLVSDPNFKLRIACKQQAARIMKTRPMFQAWSATFEVEYDAEIVDEHTLERFIETAGKLVGIGDWRPKYGRFELAK